MKKKVSMWWILVAVFVVLAGLALVIHSPSATSYGVPTSTAEGCQIFARSVSRDFIKPHIFHATGFHDLGAHISKGECHVIEFFEYESSTIVGLKFRGSYIGSFKWLEGQWQLDELSIKDAVDTHFYMGPANAEWGKKP